MAVLDVAAGPARNLFHFRLFKFGSTISRLFFHLQKDDALYIQIQAHANSIRRNKVLDVVLTQVKASCLHLFGFWGQGSINDRAVIIIVVKSWVLSFGLGRILICLLFNGLNEFISGVLVFSGFRLLFCGLLVDSLFYLEYFTA